MNTSLALLLICLLQLSHCLIKVQITEVEEFKFESEDDEELDLLNDLDIIYTIPVEMGTPWQKLNLKLDLKGDETWMWGGDCKTKMCRLRSKFNKDDSSTFTSSEESSILEYGPAKLYGIEGVDVLAIGGVKARRQIITLINSADNALSWRIRHLHGVLGLSLSQSTNQQYPSTHWFQNMIDDNPRMQKSFSLYFGDQDQPSYLILGGIDEELFYEQLIYRPLLNKDQWKIEIGNLYLDDMEAYDGSIPAVIDTNIPFILGPEDVLQEISSIKVNKDCSNINDLPTIAFAIAGQEFNFFSSEYVIIVETLSETQCFNGIISDSSLDHLIFGTLFLKKFYTHFDFENKRIGFAPALRENASEK